MIIAHLPAGYLLTRVTPKHLPIWAVLLGSICPDFDMALIWADIVHFNHHHLPTHRPAVWFAVLILGAAFKLRWLQGVAIGALLHVSLDSIAGQINWLWPIGDLTLGLIDVIAQPGWWVWSFVRHWLFGFELVICAVALGTILYRRKKKNPRSITEGSSNS